MLTSQTAERYISKCPGEHTDLQRIEVACVFLTGFAGIFFHFSSTTASVFFVLDAPPLYQLLPPFHLFPSCLLFLLLSHLLPHSTGYYRPRVDFHPLSLQPKQLRYCHMTEKNTTSLFAASLYADRTIIQPELTPPDWWAKVFLCVCWELLELNAIIMFF